MLFPWNGTFGVNLLQYAKVNTGRMKSKRVPNRFAIKDVIAGKDGIDGLCILKREKGKPP